MTLVGVAAYAFIKGSSFSARMGERAYTSPKARNVILMISDGFGPASEAFARQYHQEVNNYSENWMSPLDRLLVGSSRTRSSSSLITDSAAGATAFSCALKSYNGAIGVDPDGKPCGTVLEAAKAKGMLTGLVVTSRITHATPASFSSHVVDRNMEDLIAQQQIGNYSLGRVVDLMFGGGACHFKPLDSPQSCRVDDVDVLQAAQTKYGFTYLDTRQEFDKLEPGNSPLPLLGLFADDHMDYEIDRDPKVQPALWEMVDKALGILEKGTANQDQGFFLMIEGSRIDMAAHSNDPAAHVRDVDAYWQAVERVVQYIEDHPDTVMISVSDHETGGLTLGRQLNSTYPDYLWHPSVLQPVQRSMEQITLDLLNLSSRDRTRFVKKSVLNWMGVKDATQDEVQRLVDVTDYYELLEHLTEMLSRRALVGWTTHGHTGVDVNLYASGAGAEHLRGNHENIDIGHFIAKSLQLDLDKVTKQVSSVDTHQRISNAPSQFLYRRSDAVDVKHYHH
ncbi:vacuolar alkaline phosphatase [Dispira parvispora]|uniref:Alkaline phosphatase n=1 Tax=Dispira parvispora TaxID=1520584 RepID=A0A9W8AWK3_9FUNG|nr:vacuolar alkaline phosphatase [Dispira parvispora]